MAVVPVGATHNIQATGEFILVCKGYEPLYCLQSLTSTPLLSRTFQQNQSVIAMRLIHERGISLVHMEPIAFRLGKAELPRPEDVNPVEGGQQIIRSPNPSSGSHKTGVCANRSLSIEETQTRHRLKAHCTRGRLRISHASSD